MQAIKLLTVIFGIYISNHEMIKRAEAKFHDMDFTDYNEEEIKNKTGLPDNTKQAPQDLESGFASSIVPIKAFKVVEAIEDHLKKPQIILQNSKENYPNSKSLSRSKRQALSLAAVEEGVEEDFETIYKRIEKLGPEKAKYIFRNNRDIKALDASIFREDARTSMFTNDENSKIFLLIDKKSNITNPVLILRERYKIDNEESLERNDQNLYNERYFLRQQQRLDAYKETLNLKAKYILNFLEDHYYSTEYIHSEMVRIRKQGRVNDKFRLLIQYLESDNQESLKEHVLNCYYKRRKVEKPAVDIWKDKYPNNLIIDPIRDPYSDII